MPNKSFCQATEFLLKDGGSILFYLFPFSYYLYFVLCGCDILKCPHTDTLSFRQDCKCWDMEPKSPQHTSKLFQPDTNMVVIIIFCFSISSVFQRGGFKFSFKDENEVGWNSEAGCPAGKNYPTTPWSKILNNSLRVQLQEGCLLVHAVEKQTKTNKQRWLSRSKQHFGFLEKLQAIVVNHYLIILYVTLAFIHHLLNKYRCYS